MRSDGAETQFSATALVVASPRFASLPSVCAAISTRRGGVSPEPYGLNTSFSVGDDPANVAENRLRFLSALGIHPSQLAIPRQVHSDAVRRVDGPGEFEACDALITRRRGLFLVLTVADCLPVFLFDPVTKGVAAVHVGWRGSDSRILTRAIRSMVDSFGTLPADIIAYCGPSARVCCYEVGEDVASKFGKNYLSNSVAGGKAKLDLLKFNVELLRKEGVDSRNIEFSEYCTICTPHLFHSFRRDGKKSGRMLAVVGLKN